MKKVINLIEKEKLLIIFAIIISLFPLYIPGFFYTHDGLIHLYRTAGAYSNMVDFDFTGRIYYNIINGYGYGWGIFYPPISAVVPAIFMILGFSLFTAEKLFLIFASIFAGLFAYKLFIEILNSKFTSLLATLLYVLAPYKINQILVRGAMGEVLLFTFLPLVIFGLIKILKREYSYKYYFVFGVCGVVYSHVISTVYLAIFSLLFILVNLKFFLKKEIILELVKCLIIIVILCLPILVPLAEHQLTGIYNSNSMTAGNVANNVVHPGQLIGSSIEGKEIENTGYFSNEKEMNYMIGLTSIIIVMLLPFAYKKLKESGSLKDIIKYGILLIITLVMMILPSIWNKVGILDVIQFPWRILTFSTMFISIIAGYILKALVTEENKYSFLIFILGYSLLFVFFIGTEIKLAKTLNNDFNFNNQVLTQNDDFWSIAFALGYSHEYLPTKTSTEILKNRGNSILVLDGDAVINNVDIQRDVLKSSMLTNSPDTLIELPYIYYKGYTIKVDNNNSVYNISDNGFITLNIKDIGEHEIYLKYTGTTIYQICDFLAIITFFILIINKMVNRIDKKENKKEIEIFHNI